MFAQASWLAAVALVGIVGWVMASRTGLALCRRVFAAVALPVSALVGEGVFRLTVAVLQDPPNSCAQVFKPMGCGTSANVKPGEQLHMTADALGVGGVFLMLVVAAVFGLVRQPGWQRKALAAAAVCAVVAWVLTSRAAALLVGYYNG